jgi:hypothetical protein
MITKRIVNLWRAAMGTGLTQLEVRNAESMLELEQEELRRNVAKYNLGLAGYAAVAEKLQADKKRLEQERLQIEPKLRARLDVGDRLGASRHALRLENIETQLKDTHVKHTDTEAAYRELVRTREVALLAARDRIESLKRDIGDLRVQESLADLAELAAGMQGSLGLSSSTLDRLQQGVSDKRHFAAGRARVARDAIDHDAIETREAEQAAMAEAALARYEQRQSTPTSPTAAPQQP